MNVHSSKAPFKPRRRLGQPARLARAGRNLAAGTDKSCYERNSIQMPVRAGSPRACAVAALEGHRRMRPAHTHHRCFYVRKSMRVRFVGVCATAVIISAFGSDGALGETSPSKTRRIPGGEVVSVPWTKGLWLHTEVQRIPLICSENRTPSGRSTLHVSHHEYQTFTTIGPNPNGRRSPVQHLRLTSSIGDDPARVRDCHDTEWCGAIYEDGCRRSCASGEVWDHGGHAATHSACLYVRGR